MLTKLYKYGWVRSCAILAVFGIYLGNFMKYLIADFHLTRVEAGLAFVLAGSAFFFIISLVADFELNMVIAMFEETGDGDKKSYHNKLTNLAIVVNWTAFSLVIIAGKTAFNTFEGRMFVPVLGLVAGAICYALVFVLGMADFSMRPRKHLLRAKDEEMDKAEDEQMAGCGS
jgi:hypothetical protein